MKIIGRTSDYFGVYYRSLSEELQHKIKLESTEIQLNDFIKNVVELCNSEDFICTNNEEVYEVDFSVEPKLLGLNISSNSTNQDIVKDYPFLAGGIFVKLNDEGDVSVKVTVRRNIVTSNGSFNSLVHIQYV